MSKEKDDKKVGGIGGATKAKGVQRTREVEETEGVKGAEGVGGVKNVAGVGRPDGVKAISIQQRERLMNLVQEEAAKLAAAGMIPKSQRAVVEQAVKMVIDAAMIDGEDDAPKGKK